MLLGAADGTLLGACVGPEVGEPLSASVRLSLGDNDGLRDGESLGLSLGDNEGLEDGKSVGLPLGDNDGFRVGESLGP